MLIDLLKLANKFATKLYEHKYSRCKICDEENPYIDYDPDYLCRQHRPKAKDSGKSVSTQTIDKWKQHMDEMNQHMSGIGYRETNPAYVLQNAAKTVGITIYHHLSDRAVSAEYFSVDNLEDALTKVQDHLMPNLGFHHAETFSNSEDYPEVRYLYKDNFGRAIRVWTRFTNKAWHLNIAFYDDASEA